MSDLSVSLQALERSSSQLSVSSYFDEGLFRAEQERIFHGCPSYLGHGLAVPEVGDFQTLAHEGDGRAHKDASVKVRAPRSQTMSNTGSRHVPVPRTKPPVRSDAMRARRASALLVWRNRTKVKVTGKSVARVQRGLPNSIRMSVQSVTKITERPNAMAMVQLQPRRTLCDVMASSSSTSMAVRGRRSPTAGGAPIGGTDR